MRSEVVVVSGLHCVEVGMVELAVDFVVCFVVVSVVNFVVVVVGFEVEEDSVVVVGGPLLNLGEKVRERKNDVGSYLHSGVKVMSSMAMSESPGTPTVASMIT